MLLGRRSRLSTRQQLSSCYSDSSGRNLSLPPQWRHPSILGTHAQRIHHNIYAFPSVVNRSCAISCPLIEAVVRWARTDDSPRCHSAAVLSSAVGHRHSVLHVHPWLLNSFTTQPLPPEASNADRSRFERVRDRQTEINPNKGRSESTFCSRPVRKSPRI